MPSSALGRTQRVILLCALALGVLAMHHVNAAGIVQETVETFVADVPAAATAVASLDATPQHPDCPMCGDHDVLHVCLAVLCASAMILLALLALLQTASPFTAAAIIGPRGSPRPAPPPGEGGRAVIACLCVLRV
jgi:hypothetical protein